MNRLTILLAFLPILAFAQADPPLGSIPEASWPTFPSRPSGYDAIVHLYDTAQVSLVNTDWKIVKPQFVRDTIAFGWPVTAANPDTTDIRGYLTGRFSGMVRIIAENTTGGGGVATDFVLALFVNDTMRASTSGSIAAGHQHLTLILPIQAMSILANDTTFWGPSETVCSKGWWGLKIGIWCNSASTVLSADALTYRRGNRPTSIDVFLKRDGN